MDLYHIWCDLGDGVSDSEFTDALARFLDRLQQDGRIAGWRLTRKKLGLAPASLGEFHIMVEIENLAQLDRAFAAAAARTDPIEEIHHAVNSRVRNATFALYRDFPDPVRVRGEERF